MYACNFYILAQHLYVHIRIIYIIIDIHNYHTLVLEYIAKFHSQETPWLHRPMTKDTILLQRGLYMGIGILVAHANGNCPIYFDDFPI